MAAGEPPREANDAAVFRPQWRERQSAEDGAGQLIQQPGWINRGLVLLGVLLVGGGAASAGVTVPRTASLPAIAQGRSVTAARTSAAAPDPGAQVQFRDAAGVTVAGVTVEVTEHEVIVELGQPESASMGMLLVPAGRQRLIGVLLPSLG